MAQNCRLYPSPGTDQQKTWDSNQTNNLKKCCSTVLYNLNCISILWKTIKHQQCLSFLLPQKWIKVPKCHLWIKSKNGYLGFLEITHLKQKKIIFYLFIFQTTKQNNIHSSLKWQMIISYLKPQFFFSETKHESPKPKKIQNWKTKNSR